MGDVLCGVSGCERPVADQAYVCITCTSELESMLDDVVGVLGDGLGAELDVTLSRQDRISVSNVGSNASLVIPLPFNALASHAQRALLTAIRTQVDLVVRERDVTSPPSPLTTVDGARWLQCHVRWLRHHEAGPPAVSDLTAAVSLARRVIDRPPVLWYAGPCEGVRDNARCATELYAQPGALQVTCWACDVTYNVPERRRWLLDQVEDQLMSSVAISTVMRHWGVQIADSTIRGYAHRGRIVAHSRDARGRPLYRVGDVLCLILGPRKTGVPV